jgi:anti-sigma factor ChrR (cupin superfamily)
MRRHIFPMRSGWISDKTPGADSALLREDPQTGGLKVFVHYPAGHVFAPHWHSANERIIVLEGAISTRVGNVH